MIYVYYFLAGDTQFSSNNLQYSRAYFTLVNQSDILSFYTRLDGFPLNFGGKVYRIVVEYAPFQRSFKKKKPDSKEDSIENDPDYLAFLTSLEENKEKKASIYAYTHLFIVECAIIYSSLKRIWEFANFRSYSH